MDKAFQDHNRVLADGEKEMVTELLHLGRVTLSELMLFNACETSLRDQIEASKEIDACIQQMNALPGKDTITPMMIHTALWKFCQVVIKKGDLKALQ